MHLIFLGIQGSGKGTQAKLLLDKGYKLFETGAQLRAIAEQDTNLGKEITKMQESGNLVSDKLVCQLAANFIDSNPNSQIIFDGIPRNEGQYNEVVPMLQKKAPNFQVVNFELDPQTALTRMEKRAAIENRSDDTPEAMQRRIAIFKEHTAPLLDKFTQICSVISVDASQSIEAVNQECQSKLKLQND